jgi:hypothetical protein
MKRFSRPWKIATIVLLATAGAGAIVIAAAKASVEAKFEQQLAVLRAAGQPLSLADLGRKPPLPEQNAATYLRRAKDYLDAVDKEVSAAYENEPPAAQEAIDLDRPTPRYVEAIRAALAAYPKTISLLEQAAACPEYDSQLDYQKDTESFLKELTRQIQLSRQGMRTLRYRAQLQIADGQYDEAIGTCLAMLRLCRLLDREPTLIGGLVALACRGVTVSSIDCALRLGDVSDATRDALDEELKRHDVVEVYRHSLATDRAFGLEVLREVAAGKHRELLQGNDAYYFRATGFKNDECGYLDYMAESLALAGKPYREAIDSPTLAKALASVGALADQIAPATKACHAAVNRAQVYLRCLRILNVIQRFEKSHPDREPTLIDLGLPAEVTTDPFNGQPLHLVKKPNGWLIYAVDMNLKDDGGKSVPTDSGFGPLPRTRDE